MKNPLKGFQEITKKFMAFEIRKLTDIGSGQDNLV